MENSIIGFSRGENTTSSFKAFSPVTGETSNVSYAHASANELEIACWLAKEASQALAQKSGASKADFLECVAE